MVEMATGTAMEMGPAMEAAPQARKVVPQARKVAVTSWEDWASLGRVARHNSQAER